MATLKFKATKEMQAYCGTIDFKDGDEKELPDEEANRIVADFPKNFSIKKAGGKAETKQLTEAKDKGF